MADPIPARVRALVRARSGGRCEVELPGCRGVAAQQHHRRRKGMGGDPRPSTNTAANLLDVCLWCHQRIESRRTEAQANGHLVHPVCEDPGTVPLVYRGNFGCRLDVDGGLTVPGAETVILDDFPVAADLTIGPW